MSASRRRFLQAATGGLIAGVVAPLMSRRSSAVAAEKRAGKVLITYYSRTGTTREVATQIQRKVGGDLF